MADPTFAFRSHERVESAIRRIARDEINDLLRGLTGRRRVVRDKLVHELRKSMKRLRALLRVVGDSLHAKARHRGNRAFRDAARGLAAARDARVLLDTFEALLVHFKDRILPDSFQPARARLMALRRAASRAPRESDAPVVQVLRDARDHVRDWTLDGEDFGAIKGGLRRIFRRGRRAFATARAQPSPETQHEWRKRVKDLWHAVQLLEPIWPEVLGQFGDKAHELADCLGDDHDLSVLRQTIVAAPSHFGPAECVEALLALIDARRVELRQAAMVLGDRVYGETPAAFIQRMRWYWDAWKRGEG